MGVAHHAHQVPAHERRGRQSRFAQLSLSVTLGSLRIAPSVEFEEALPPSTQEGNEGEAGVVCDPVSPLHHFRAIVNLAAPPEVPALKDKSERSDRL